MASSARERFYTGHCVSVRCEAKKDDINAHDGCRPTSNDLTQSDNGVKIIYFNAQSLSADKYSSLKTQLADKYHNTIVAVTETNFGHGKNVEPLDHHDEHLVSRTLHCVR
jgi:hypothetical protein